MSISYNRDIPLATNSPSVDQPNMKINTNAIDQIISVDHINFNQSASTPGGFHTVTHLLTQGTWNAVTRTGAPANTANTNEVFGLSYTPDTAGATADIQLFSQTALGGISQLTGNSATTSGWIWSSGLLIQWGFVNGTHSGGTFNGGDTGTVTFKNRTAGAIPFPRNIFTITTQVLYNSSLGTPGGAATVAVDFNPATFTNTSFNWTFFTNASNYRQFMWIAIGQ